MALTMTRCAAFKRVVQPSAFLCRTMACHTNSVLLASSVSTIQPSVALSAESLGSTSSMQISDAASDLSTADTCLFRDCRMTSSRCISSVMSGAGTLSRCSSRSTIRPRTGCTASIASLRSLAAVLSEIASATAISKASVLPPTWRIVPLYALRCSSVHDAAVGVVCADQSLIAFRSAPRLRTAARSADPDCVRPCWSATCRRMAESRSAVKALDV